jgi:hypothetical protein
VSITPSVMMAASGMMNGQGIGVNTTMTSKVNSAASNPISVLYVQLQANAANVAGLSDTLSSLPSAYGTVTSTASAVTTQAAKMVPNIKGFITIQSGASSFGAASAEYSAALTQFGNKSFGDLGIGMGNFADANSMGMTSLTPAVNSLGIKAKTAAFGSIGGLLDPNKLLQGQATMGNESVKAGLSSVSDGLKNYGTLMDFKDPMSLGPKNLVQSLQDQGLAASVGINDMISAQGYDPTKLALVPEPVLIDVLSNVKGSDLDKILSQTGTKTVSPITSAADLLNVNNVLPPQAVNSLGLKGAGSAGLKGLGNTFMNIGVPLTAASASNIMSGVQSKVGGYLNSVNTLVPSSIKTSLSSVLGAGSGPFGNPTMNDMMGSAAGHHTDDFITVGKALNGAASSPQGQALVTAMQTLQDAMVAMTDTTAPYAALQTAVTNFNNYVAGNSNIKSALDSAGTSLSNIGSHLSKEISNLSLAGLNLNSLPSPSAGMTQVMSFASKLHSFGTDKLQLGHFAMLDGAGTNDLTGDAIRASLLEGKNLGIMSGIGKLVSSVGDTLSSLSVANLGMIAGAIAAFKSAGVDAQAAYQNVQTSKTALAQAQTVAAADPGNTALQTNAIAAATTYTAALDDWNYLVGKKDRLEVQMMDVANGAGTADALAQAQAAQADYYSKVLDTVSPITDTTSSAPAAQLAGFATGLAGKPLTPLS